MPLNTRSWNGTPNRGPRRDRRRLPAGHASYVMSGPLAWVDRGARLLVLRVDGGNRRARRLMGLTVTVQVADARVSAPDRDADGAITVADLRPGERVTVSASLPRHLQAVPELITARAVRTHDWT